MMPLATGGLIIRRNCARAASPEDINNGEAKSFLRTFGQANREQFDRQPGGSILQAMTLMNSPFVTRRVTAANGSLVEQLVKSTNSGAPSASRAMLTRKD
jgi:hypothetical protein